MFACNDWIKVRRDVSKRSAKVLELKSVEESQISAVKSRFPVIAWQSTFQSDNWLVAAIGLGNVETLRSALKNSIAIVLI